MRTLRIHYQDGNHKDFINQNEKDIARFYKNAPIETIQASEILGITNTTIKPLKGSPDLNVRIKLKLVPLAPLPFKELTSPKFN